MILLMIGLNYSVRKLYIAPPDIFLSGRRGLVVKVSDFHAGGRDP